MVTGVMKHAGELGFGTVRVFTYDGKCVSFLFPGDYGEYELFGFVVPSVFGEVVGNVTVAKCEDRFIFLHAGKMMAERAAGNLCCVGDLLRGLPGVCGDVGEDYFLAAAAGADRGSVRATVKNSEKSKTNYGGEECDESLCDRRNVRHWGDDECRQNIFGRQLPQLDGFYLSAVIDGGGDDLLLDHFNYQFTVFQIDNRVA